MLRNSKAFSGFSVDDLDAAKRFYGETLGVQVSENDAGLTLDLAGGRPTLIYPKDDHEPASFTILNFPVDDIEGTVAGLAERGVQFERYEGTPLETDEQGIFLETDEQGIFRGGGPPIAWFKDPAGNVLSVIKAD
jgi:catechol 2,3-dioxygenase-like lactoylglutathione lyase family enzyme